MFSTLSRKIETFMKQNKTKKKTEKFRNQNREDLTIQTK